MTSATVRSALVAALTAALVALAPAGSVSAGPSFGFDVVVGTECLDGFGPANALHTIRLFTPQGDLRASTRTTSDETGAWSACFGDHAIFAGDKVRASSGSSARTWAIPRISMNITRTSDIIRGRAPASSSFTLTVLHTEGFKGASSHPRAITAAANGAWTTDYTDEIDVRGGDTVRLDYVAGPDRVTLLSVVPYMTVYRANNVVRGWLLPGRAATIFLTDATGRLRGRAFVSTSLTLGRFESFLHTPGGLAAYPRQNDRVTADFARDAAFVVPNVVVLGSAASDSVSGVCLPGRPYQVQARRADGSGSATATGVTGTDGSFSASLAGSIDIQPGDRVEVVCKFPTGDQVGRAGLAS